MDTKDSWIGIMKLNQKNFDGSVSSYFETNQPGAGYSVPFSHTEFLSQIEENILEAVLILNSKGYTTITSCHGHSLFQFVFKKAIRFNSGPQITIKLEQIDRATIKKFSNWLISSSINDSISNYGNYLSIRVRKPLNVVLSNKLSCRIIENFCRKLEDATMES